MSTAESMLHPTAADEQQLDSIDHAVAEIAAGHPVDVVRPGHLFPLHAHDGGVPARPGHSEAGVDLCRLAGLRPAAAVCEIANADGTMARLPELRGFARRHGLALISIADLGAHLRPGGGGTEAPPAPAGMTLA